MFPAKRFINGAIYIINISKNVVIKGKFFPDWSCLKRFKRNILAEKTIGIGPTMRCEIWL